MSQFFMFVILGLGAGSIYSLAAIGLVLTFRTSGVLNLAQGALATLAAFGYYTLNVTLHLPWLLSAVITVGIVGVVLGTILEVLTRRLQGTTLVVSIACTVGLLLAIEAAIVLVYGTETVRQVPAFLTPGGVTFGSIVIQWADVETLMIAAVLAIGLSAYLKMTRAGTAARAVVDNPELLAGAGMNPVAVRRTTWVVASALAAVSGVLFAPLIPLDPVELTLLVVSAFGAAAIGGFRSLPVTFAGGLIIGIVASLATRYLTAPQLAGVSPSIPFLVLIAALLLLPRKYLTLDMPHHAPEASGQTRLQTQVLLGAAAIILLCLVPLFAGIHLDDWTAALGTIVILLSLSLLVRTAGQVSLCQISFAAVGATTLGHLVSAGIPWLVALLFAGIVVMPIGALLAIVALRVSGLYLALATLGFGILLQYMFYPETYFFGPYGIGVTVPRPNVSILSNDRPFYYFVLLLVTVCTVIVVGFERGRLGRLLKAMAASRQALESVGTHVTVTRVAAFCLSAFFAAVGGALVGAAYGNASADSYPPLLSLTLFAVVVVMVGKAPWNSVFGGIALIIVPSYIAGPTISTILQLIFGVGAIAFVFAPNNGMKQIEWLRPLANLPKLGRASNTPLGSRTEDVGTARPAISRRLGVAPHSPMATTEQIELKVEGLRVRFGGLDAVRDVSMVARSGEITGIIGPNGAGKTTTFNACSGIVRASAGKIVLGSHDITRLGPTQRARYGIGRTFQQATLFESMTVQENIELGREGRFAGLNPAKHIFSYRSERRRTRDAAAAAIDICNINYLTDAVVAELSTGQRRLVDLARCLAGESKIVLLDEPAAGLDDAESAALAQVLQSVVDERGIGVVLVEHDWTLVHSICSHVYVLDFGQIIAQGSPTEVMDSPAVRSAYLGELSVTA